jgi:hypothetical protein
MRTLVVTIAVVGLLVGAAAIAPDVARAETVAFWLPPDTMIDAANEEIVFFQGPVATTWLEAKCGVPGSGDYPMQTAMAAVTGASPSRLFGVIVLTEIAPQTRVANLTFTGSCVVGGVRYRRFFGNVQ